MQKIHHLNMGYEELVEGGFVPAVSGIRFSSD